MIAASTAFFMLKPHTELLSHAPSLWTLLLAAASQLLIVIRWFGLFTSSKGLQKKNSNFWLEMWTSTALLIWFSFRLWLMSLFVLVAFPPLGRERRPPSLSVIFTASTLPLTSAGLLQSVWSHDVFVSPCRVLGKRKRDSYVRALGWPVKAPLFPVLSSARLTSSSWSAAYVWTATTTLKSFPACTLSVRGEFSCGTSSGLLLEGVW